jgi:hypothetical protein
MSTARTSTERARAHQLRLKTRLDELHTQMGEIKAQNRARPVTIGPGGRTSRGDDDDHTTNGACRRAPPPASPTGGRCKSSMRPGGNARVPGSAKELIDGRLGPEDWRGAPLLEHRSPCRPRQRVRGPRVARVRGSPDRGGRACGRPQAARKELSPEKATRAQARWAGSKLGRPVTMLKRPEGATVGRSPPRRLATPQRHLRDNAAEAEAPVMVPRADSPRWVPYRMFESLTLRQSRQSGHSFSCACRRPEWRRTRAFAAILPKPRGQA